MAKRPAKKAPAKAKRPAPKAKPSKAPAAKSAKPAKSTGKAVSTKAKHAAPKPIARPAARGGARTPPPPYQRPTPPPPPLALPKPPATEAVAAFERGMADIQKKNYSGAASTFRSLLERFPSEGFLADRARVYLELAERELRKRPAASGGIEERLTAATAALNNNDYAEATRLADSVLSEDASQDLASYLLAVIATRKGDHFDALAHLKHAIAVNPENRVQARQDEEFDPLFELDEFHDITTAPAPSVAPPPPPAPKRKGR